MAKDDKTPFLDAVSALEQYYIVWAESAAGNGTDIDSLWDVAIRLRNSLENLLERAIATEPENAAWLRKALAGLDAIAMEHLLESDPGEAIRQLKRISSDRRAALPERVIVRFFQAEDREVRLAAIAAFGDRVKTGKKRAEPASRSQSR